MKLNEDQTVVYDFESPSCEVYDIIDKKTLKFRTNLAPRSILQKTKIGQSEKDAIGIFVDDDELFQECLFFDTLHGKSIFHYIIKKQQIFGAIISRILDINQDMIPFLMFKDRTEKQSTCLDLLVEEKQQKSLQSILNMIIYHEQAAPFYNSHVDKHLISLIGLNINLSDLFNSEILYHQLSTFETLSTNNQDELWASNCTKLREILLDTDKVALQRHQWITTGAIDQFEAAKGNEAAKPIALKKNPEDNNDAMSAVEYKIINLQQTLLRMPSDDKENLSLMQQLSAY